MSIYKSIKNVVIGGLMALSVMGGFSNVYALTGRAVIENNKVYYSDRFNGIKVYYANQGDKAEGVEFYRRGERFLKTYLKKQIDKITDPNTKKELIEYIEEEVYNKGDYRGWIFGNALVLPRVETATRFKEYDKVTKEKRYKLEKRTIKQICKNIIYNPEITPENKFQESIKESIKMNLCELYNESNHND